MRNFVRKIKAVSVLVLCLALCIGNFTFVQTAEAAVDVFNDMQAKVYNDGNGTQMSYRLFIPADYTTEKTYPVIIFLHGDGGQGTDNMGQLWNMLPALFGAHSQVAQSIVIAPQCHEGKRWVETDWWRGNYDSDAIPEEQLGIVMKILEEVQSQYSTDNDRIYAMGLSMGGFGAWNLLMKHSDVFAAGVPVCGGADVNKATVLKDVPIWTFHGTADPTVPYSGTAEMVQAIQDVGGTEIIFTSYEGVDHYSWDRAATQAGLIDWLFSKKLSKRGMVAEYAPEIVSATYNAKADRLTVKIDTTESLHASQTEKMILAVYDQEGRLIKAKTGDIGSTVQNVNWRLNGGRTPATVKVTLWSNTDYMHPVSYLATAPVTE